ncbi:MAG TPA: hypothetical protein VLF18_01655 [Tahibacter sp.]|uniref:hypothetical protein n=1 Tax=Tahibacter sp. TaxID=2056211 RepID=UPI002C570A31|nr:hypothetical protein [Tahibacter sp.]HSX58880.1 hypothetical protein [Tahibacter sp.]
MLAVLLSLAPAARHPLDLARASYVGHSYGGLSGAYLLATRPQAFARYMLIGPSLWYDGGVIFRLIADRASMPPRRRCSSPPADSRIRSWPRTCAAWKPR